MAKIKKFSDFKKEINENSQEQNAKILLDPNKTPFNRNPEKYTRTGKVEEPISIKGLQQQFKKDDTKDQPVKNGRSGKGDQSDKRKAWAEEQTEFQNKKMNTENPDLDKDGTKKGQNINEKVNVFGKIAKFPKGTKVKSAVNFVQKNPDIKLTKNDIWYLMIEKQDTELQMIKYNCKKGVELSTFISELKKYYITKFAKNKDLVKCFENIEVEGNTSFSVIKNIPYIEVGGRKVISIIAEDLIKLLSK